MMELLKKPGNPSCWEKRSIPVFGNFAKYGDSAPALRSVCHVALRHPEGWKLLEIGTCPIVCRNIGVFFRAEWQVDAQDDSL